MDSAERWRRIWEIFESALEIPEGQLDAWLAQACGDDARLRQDVESLLAAHQKSHGILEQTVSAFRVEKLYRGSEPAAHDEQVGPYRILSEIGRGGMAVVYKAEDPRLGRYVALKFLPGNLTASAQAKDRLLSEARAASRLDHPNICTVYDIGETDDGRLFLAMAYYEGQTLAQRIDAGPLPVEEAIAITIQVARALEHAHDAGVIHRDIKPSNIFLTARGEVKVLDFGLAKQGAHPLTEPGTRLGTVLYMSPEQAQGKDVDRRTDLWSLGATLYEMLAGRPPFSGENEAAVLYKIVHEDSPPLGAGAGESVQRIVTRLLAKNPKERYQDARELLADLGAPPATTIPDELPMALVGPQRRTPWLAAIVAAVVAVVAVAGYWFGVRGPEDGVTERLDPIPLTSFPGREEMATFSPDGAQVAFSWDGPDQDNFDIYVKLIDSPTPLRLTDNPAWDSSPAWSPDGRHIAFLREREPRGAELRLIPPIGGSERLLTTVDAPERSGISWSADGRFVVVADRPSPNEPPAVTLVSVDTGEKRLLIAGPAGTLEVRSPVFSPDGQTIAFDVLRGGGLGDTYLASAGGRELKQLTFTGGQPEGLAWSNDGRYLIFARLSEEGRRSTWRVPVSGGEPKPMALGDNPSQPALAPAGNRMAFSKRLSSYDIIRIDRLGVDPKRPSRFVSSTRFDGNPQYSPDGSRIVFSSSRSGNVEIWVSDAAGGNLLQLTSLGVAGSPRWSPDSTQILFDSTVGGNADIYLINASGGTPRRITTNAAEDVVPSWSRDGKWIYFCSTRTGQDQVWKISAESAPEPEGKAVQVTRHGGFRPIESADGRYVYYAKQRGPETSLWRVPAAGGEERLIISNLQSGWGNWEVVSDGIYFVNPLETGDRPLDAEWAVYFHHFHSGRMSKVLPLAHRPTRGGPGLGVSPDGRWFLNGQVAVDSDLMLVENFR